MKLILKNFQIPEGSARQKKYLCLGKYTVPNFSKSQIASQKRFSKIKKKKQIFKEPAMSLNKTV